MRDTHDKLVYLAGPISGTTSSVATSWREEFGSLLKSDIRCLSPLRDQTDSTPDYPLHHGEDSPCQKLGCQR